MMSNMPTVTSIECHGYTFTRREEEEGGIPGFMRFSHKMPGGWLALHVCDGEVLEVTAIDDYQMSSDGSPLGENPDQALRDAARHMIDFLIEDGILPAKPAS